MGGWFGVVRSHPRSSAMSSFDRAHMIAYSSLTETMRLSCTVFTARAMLCAVYAVVVTRRDKYDGLLPVCTRCISTHNLLPRELCSRGISLCYGRVSVCRSVCPSQVGVLLKWLNIGISKQRRTIAQGIEFSDAKSFRNSDGVIPERGAKCRWGRSKLANLAVSRKRYKIDA